MSFAATAYLFGLLAPPALTAWYVLRERSRGRGAPQFAAPAMGPSVAPHRPGWRRHAPVLLFGLALVALILAAARPRRTVSVPVQGLASMLALDMSGSMQATDVTPNRATAAQRAADGFVTGVPRDVSVGVMQFNQTPTTLQLPTRNRTAALSALGSLQIGGGTSLGSAIELSLSVLRRPGDQTAKGATAVIVLLSDGKSTSGPDPLSSARAAARLHIPIFTVSLGTSQGTIAVHKGDKAATVEQPVPPDPQTLSQIARVSGGQSYTATDAGHLSDIYRRLSVQLAHHNENRDLTAYAVGLGLTLLLLGSALSLKWFGRLI